MLSKSNINPFDSQEAKPYKNDPEIIAMTRLRYSFFTLKTLEGNQMKVMMMIFQRGISK